MANNNYGPPPPVMNNHPYYLPTPLQQQQQSERISGDGEEVYGYNNYLRPMAQGPPIGMVSPMLMPPAAPPPVSQQQGSGQGAPPPYGYDPNYPPLPPPPSSAPVVNNGYEQYDYGPSSLLTPQQNEEEYNLGAVPLQDNRSVDGEEQYIGYSNGPPSLHHDLGMGSSTVPSFGVSVPSTVTEVYQPEGVQQSFQPVHQELRSETIGSDVNRQELPNTLISAQIDDDDRESGGYPSIGQQVENDPRSIDGQEYPPETQNIPIGATTNSVYSTNSSSSPLSQEQRSQTIGSEVQVENNSRSIEGQEQLQSALVGHGSQVVVGLSHASSNVAPAANPPSLSSHQRSETLGSDTVLDDPRQSQKSKSSKVGNHHNSGSETGDSASRSTRGDGRRRREPEAEYSKSRGKGKGKERDYERDTNRSHHSRQYPSDDESEDDDYDDRRSNRDYRRRERDRDYEVSRSHKTRGREGDKDKSRKEWETSRDTFTRPYRREYDFEDEHSRPRSRSSYHHDESFEYYSSRRRREENDPFKPPRGPPSEYGIRPYPRYTDYGPSSGPFGVPSGRNQYAPPAGYDPHAAFNPQSSQAALQNYLVYFRTQDPAQYRVWHAKYTAHMRDPARIPFPHPPGFPVNTGNIASKGVPTNASNVAENFRVPPQSGRSSVVDENVGLSQDESRFKPIKENAAPTPPPRNTPLLFPTPHAIAKFSPLGFCLRNRNGSSTIEFVNLRQLTKRLPEYKEMKAFPGPLIKDVTHKNTIVQFCQRKIRETEVNDSQFDKENLILLWELLILLLRQNGSAIGSDIAELLLKSKSTGKSIESESNNPYSESDEESETETKRGNAVNTNQRYQSNDSEQKCVDIFCQKLIYGHKREALEYAMDNSLWGHALFFASKMDEKLYGTVLARFANGTMSLNSPLQTLYHVLSGKQPPSVTCCSEESFGDWKPHLAMLLSNMGQRPEFEANTMRTLGRTLANRNLKYAAQFCYLMAESEFSEESDIGPLLGYNSITHNILEATQMTEIYEFAMSLSSPNFSLGASFIERKLNYAKELINLGFIQEAYSYTEEMTKTLRKNRFHSNERTLAKNILYISERLVYCDTSRGAGEPGWIEDLRKMADQLDSETTSRKLSIATTASDNIDDANSNANVHPYQINQMQPLTSYDGHFDSQSIPLMTANNTPSTNNDYSPETTQQPISNQWNQNPMQQPIQTYTPAMPYQPPDPNSFQQPVPNFQPNGPINTSDNNNYWDPSKINSSGGNFSTPAPVNKKKVVRFEDDDVNGDTKQTLKARQLDYLQSKVLHEKSSAYSHVIRRKSNSIDSLNNLVDRLALQELKNSQSRSPKSSPVDSPVKFKSTFPIDQPISKSVHFNTVPARKKKVSTYPVDEKCCDLNEPCDEHDDYLYETGYDYNSRHDADEFLHNTTVPDLDFRKNSAPQQQSAHEHQRQQQQPSSIPRTGSKSEQHKSKNDSSKNQPKTKGWLSGMFSKFIKNDQAILPDDKNPTIVWDEATKSWKNMSGDDDEDSGPKGPPPTDSDLMKMTGGGTAAAAGPPMPVMSNGFTPNSANPQLPINGLPKALNVNPQIQHNNNNNINGGAATLPPAGPNKFQRPKGIKLRNNYVDVFNSSSNANPQQKPDDPTVPLPVTPMSGPGMPNIFMPPPLPQDSGSTNANFLTASSTDNSEESNEMQAPPPMFNPAQFQNQNNNIHNYGLNR